MALSKKLLLVLGIFVTSWSGAFIVCRCFIKDSDDISLSAISLFFGFGCAIMAIAHVLEG